MLLELAKHLKFKINIGQVFPSERLRKWTETWVETAIAFLDHKRCGPDSWKPIELKHL